MIIFLVLILLILILLILLFVIITGIFFAIDFFLDLPYVATKKEKIETILKLANIKKVEVVIDLGSGDGRLLFAAAQKGAYAIGYEINPFLIWLTRIKAYLLGYSSSDPAFHEGRGSREVSLRNSSRQVYTEPRRARTLNKGVVTVRRQNLWQADLKAADVIFVYGRKKNMQDFEDFVYQNAKKGTRIIVNTDLTNPFPTQKPLESENGLFLYKV